MGERTAVDKGDFCSHYISLRSDPDASPERFSRHALTVGGPGADPGHAGGTVSPNWSGNALGAGRSGWEERSLGLRGKIVAHATHRYIGRKWMDGFVMEG